MASAWTLIIGTAVVATASSCRDEGSCGKLSRSSQAIFGGTERENLLGMTEPQLAAVVEVTAYDDVGREWTAPCSGVVVSSRQVVSASHCFPSSSSLSVARVRVGSNSHAPDVELYASSWATERISDGAILTLDQEVPKEVLPIPLSANGVEYHVGATVLIAGYGATEENMIGLRRFAESKIVGTAEGRLVSAAGGETGSAPCTADSGGPALFREDGRLVVIGILSQGQSSCRGKDFYTPASTIRAWGRTLLEEETKRVGCDAITAIGLCFESTFQSQAVWCDNSMLQVRNCVGPEVCAGRGELHVGCVEPSSPNNCDG
jgi:hypothetical protein